MTLPPFDHEQATDLSSAYASVRDGAIPYCGGTELLGAMNLGLLRPERIVSVRAVPELRGIEVRDDIVRIGAAVTHREVSGHADIQRTSPLLAQVCRHVGNVRVRSTGTLGGNLAFAEPRSDLSTVLIALGAEVVLCSGEDERRLPVDEFLLGPYESDLAPGELVLRIDVPTFVADLGTYRKVTVTERPVVGVALVRLRVSGRWRVVVGAVGDEPMSFDVDTSEEIDPEAIAEAVEVLPDASGSEPYKRRLVRVTVARCLDDALAQLTEETR